MDDAPYRFHDDALARSPARSGGPRQRGNEARRFALGRWGLPLMFLVYGLFAIPSIAYVTPPIQVSDELSHYQRADMVYLGELECVSEHRNRLGGVGCDCVIRYEGELETDRHAESPFC